MALAAQGTVVGERVEDEGGRGVWVRLDWADHDALLHPQKKILYFKSPFNICQSISTATTPMT